MRIFYALTFNDNTKQKIIEYRDLVKTHSKVGRFTEQANYHLTLKYIGEIEENILDDYLKVLDNIDFFPNKLIINKVSKFQKKNKFIIWLGVKDNDVLYKLQIQILKLIDIDTEKFTPHITMARQAIILDSFDDIEINNVVIPVHSIALMESKRVNGKLVYETIKEILL